jgi:hypothetical protein
MLSIGFRDRRRLAEDAMERAREVPLIAHMLHETGRAIRKSGQNNRKGG